MRGRFAPHVIGVGLLGLSVFMLIFSIYAFFANEKPLGFLVCAAIAAVPSLIFLKLGNRQANPSRREALTGVLLLWFLLPLIGSVPYVFSGSMPFIDALFESMSGFTATGATALRDFDVFPKSLFLWRSLTQWFGGVGIIVLFIAVFPQLAIAGRQLFFAEAPGPVEEKLSPRLRNTAIAVLYVYVALTLLCLLLYWIFGMSFYNAVNHAFTTVSAAGFSPEGRSFEAFSPVISWIAVVFMFLAGANFALLYKTFVSQRRALINDLEFRVYVCIALTVAALLFLAILSIYSPAEALRHSVFQTMSILTTTGYATTDFAAWPRTAQMLLLILMFIGGSAGSAAGGIKIVRWLMLAETTKRELRRTLYPRGVFLARLNGKVISEDILRSVAAFITLFAALLALSTALLIAFGADFVTAFAASIACLGNVGPGIAGVGPMANFSDLHTVSKAILIFDMYAGRLEILTVFVIFQRDWWHLPKSWGKT